MTTPRPDRDILRAAVALAIHAPSVHNTQPWRWSIDAGVVRLSADWTRQVPVTDPDGRDLIVSCGVVLHHLRVALAALGWQAVVHRVPNPVEPDHLATVEVRPHTATRHEAGLAAVILRRRSDRRQMSSWPVPADHLELVADRARHEDVLCVPVTDPTARFHLAGAIAQAAVAQASDPAYVTELVRWTGRGGGADEGVPSASIPTSGATRAYPHGMLTEATGRSYSEHVEYLVIATQGDDVRSRLRAGEATSAALLCATELGLATCPMSQALEVAGTRRLIQDDVLDDAGVPQLIIRVGWAPAGAEPLPVTPRRSVADVIARPDARPGFSTP